MTVTDPYPVLIADIGATNARFAMARADGIGDTRVLACADYPGIDSAIRDYLDAIGAPRPPRHAAIAIACPVTGDHVQMTNCPWAFSTSALQRDLGLEHLAVINDFVAVALAVPHLGEAHRRRVGGIRAEPDAPVAVLGPGTGLGVSSVVPTGTGWIALAGEGGHVTMPAADDNEAAVLSIIRRRFPHVSAERVLSGMGLVELYTALCELHGRKAAARDPAGVTTAALDGSCPVCVAAVDMFCAMLGTVAGNLALTVGARGGVFVAGGIVPRLGEGFDRSAFRERFEAKGRMRAWLDAVPAFVITHPYPAFVGLESLFAPQPASG
jgi:glucokinase